MPTNDTLPNSDQAKVVAEEKPAPSLPRPPVRRKVSAKPKAEEPKPAPAPKVEPVDDSAAILADVKKDLEALIDMTSDGQRCGHGMLVEVWKKIP